MTRLLLLAYPRAWRQRYGEELLQLVDDIGLSPRVAVDLIAAGSVERLLAVKSVVLGGTTMFIAPAWRHPRGAAVLALVVLAPVMTFVVGSILAYQIGVTPLVGPFESINAWLAPNGIVSLLLVVSPVVALLLALSPLVRLELRPGESGSEAVVGVRLRLSNLVVGGLALVIGGLLAWHVVFESLAERGA